MGVATVLVCLLAMASADLPLEVEAARVRDAVELRLGLRQDLPSAVEEALPSGAVVRVVYPVRVRSARWLLWDRRVWKGDVVSSVVFDPVTGRYRCELVLDGVIVAARETSVADDARRWLQDPPPVRLSLPAGRREEALHIRVRAVFSSSTVWLVFPSVTGTEWVEVPIETPAGSALDQTAPPPGGTVPPAPGAD